MDNQARVLAVFAHPDDETYGPGGTLAKLASEGADVRLITLTRGESATMGDSPLYSPETLADVRERELECACRELGINEHDVFRFPDRGLAGVPHDELADPIADALDFFRPHLVITFHLDGISGHEDHRTVSRIVTDLVRMRCERDERRVTGGPAGGVTTGGSGGAAAAGSHCQSDNSDPRARSSNFPERGDSPAPGLAYYVIPESVGARIAWRRIFTVPDDSVTHALEVGAFLDTKTAAAKCHKTQRYMLERLSGAPGGLVGMWKYEYFIVRGHRRGGPPEPRFYHDG